MHSFCIIDVRDTTVLRHGVITVGRYQQVLRYMGSTPVIRGVTTTKRIGNLVIETMAYTNA